MLLFAIQLAFIGLVATSIGLLLGWLMQWGLVFVLRDLLPPNLPGVGLKPLAVGAATGFIGLAGFALPTVRALTACVCINLALAVGVRGGAAAVGLELAPTTIRAEAILRRLPDAPRGEVPSLLSLLPPLSERASIESVASWLTNEDAEVRSAAAEALRHSNAGHTLEVLSSLRRNPAARLGVALTYGRMGSSQCTPLLEMLSDPSPEVRAAAADGAGRCGLATVDRLASALEHEKDPGAARALVRSLGNVGGDEAVGVLARVLESGDATLRFEAVRALGCTAAPRAFPLLLAALDDPDPGIRTMALSSLGDLGDVRAEEPLSRHIDDPDRDRRRMAAAALERLYGEESASRLEGALADPDREVRLVAVSALGRLQLPGTIAALERLAEEDPDPVVRHTAVSMAARLQDPPAEAQ